MTKYMMLDGTFYRRIAVLVMIDFLTIPHRWHEFATHCQFIGIELPIVCIPRTYSSLGNSPKRRPGMLFMPDVKMPLGVTAGRHRNRHA